MPDNSLEIIINAEDNASSILKNIGENANELNKDFTNLLKTSKIQLAAGFAAATGALYAMISAADESQTVTRKLENALKNTDDALGNTTDKVLELSASLQQQSIYSDEAITSAQTLFIQFGNISSEIMPQATQATLDLASALGTDLQTASQQLGVALSEPAEGVGRLTRSIPALKGATGDLIVEMAKSGDVMGAQKLLLDTLEKTYGGEAKIQAESFSGTIKRIGENAGNTAEILGTALLDSLTKLTGGAGINGANTALIQLNSYLQQNREICMGLIIIIGTLALTFGILLVAALGVMAGAATVTIAIFGLFAAAIALVVYTVITQGEAMKEIFITQLETMKLSLIDFVNNLSLQFTSATQIITTNILGWVTLLQNSWNTMIENAKVSLETFKNTIINKIMETYNGAKAWVDKIVGFMNDIKSAAEGAINAVKNAFNLSTNKTSKQFGGYVDTTGLALLHAGEFVLSKDMQSGRGPMPSGITNNFTQPITINATSGLEPDWDTLSYRLAFILRNSR